MKRFLAAGVVLVGITGCAPADPESAGGDVQTSMAATAPPEVRFTALDFRFEGPEAIDAGMTTVVLANQGPNLHHIQFFRLLEGKTVADVEALVSDMKPTDPTPPWLVPHGGVNPPDPGAETRAALDMPAGEYAVVCLVDLPDHVPHVMKGMIRPLTVRPGTAPAAAPPVETLTLHLVDYAFGFSAPPAAGRQWVKVINDGPQPHEIAVFRLKPGKTMDDFAAWGASYEGEPPVESVGGAPGMAVGQVQWVELDLTPGEYIAACFVFDSGDGRPHLMHGMVMPFTVA